MARQRTLFVLIRAAVVALVGAASSGCLVSPQPEPPSLDLERVQVTYPSDDPERLRFVGEPEAASPPGASLRIRGVDDPTVSVSTTVDDEGGFEVELFGVPGQEFLLQVVDGLSRSALVPVVTPGEDGPVESVERPFDGECLEIDPGEVVDFGEVPLGDAVGLEVRISNHCEEHFLIEGLVLAREQMEEAACLDEAEACYEGLNPETIICEDELDLCDEACNLDYETCLGEGTPPEECFELLLNCARTCSEVELDCIESFCGDLEEQCFEASDGSWEGFDVVVAEGPLELFEHGGRTILVTFSPIEVGPVEELLTFDIVGPEFWSATLLVTGTGVE